MGGYCAGLGTLMLVVPHQFDSPVYAAPRPVLPFCGASVAGGLALLVVWHVPAPPAARRAVHLLAGGVLLVWLLAGSLQLRLWTGILTFGGICLALILLPWLSPHLAALDRRRLRTHLALASVVLVSVPLIGVTAWLTNQAEHATTAERLLGKRVLATAIAQTVEEYIGLHRAGVVSLAKTPGLLDLPRDDLSRQLRQYGTAYPEVFAWTVVDAAGDPVATADELPRRNVAGLAAFQAARDTGQAGLAVRFGAFSGRPRIVLSAPGGSPACCSPPWRPAKSRPDREHVRRPDPARLPG